MEGADKLYEIMTKLYTENPDGICGNDDCGQMSAWYVFSSLGFYPVNPVGGEYELGIPMFREASVAVGGGSMFVVKAPALSDNKRYFKSVKLNGKPLDRTFITHEEIMAGGELEFEMATLADVK